MPITPLLTAEIPVQVTAGFPSALIDVRITPLYDGIFDPNFWDPEFVDIGWLYDQQPQIPVAIDGALSSVAFPRTIGATGARRQILPPWRFLVGSTEIHWYRRLHGTTVSESIDGIMQFSFSAPRRGSTTDPFAEPLGSPRSWLGIPGGKQPVTITAQLLLEGGGSREITLVQDGIFDNTSGKVSEGGDTRTWNGGGAHARVDRVPITYQAPPGHGQLSGTVVRRLLTLAGVNPTKIAISGGRRLYKELSFIDAPAIVSANAILLPESKRVYHDDRTDTWRLLDYSGIADKRIEGVITADDVLSALGILGDDAANDSPTCIVLTSTAQVTKDECGRRLDIQVSRTFTIRRIFGAWYAQKTGPSSDPTAGDLLDLGDTDPMTPSLWQGADAALRQTSLTISVREIDCETLISEEVVTWGWFSPRIARYHVNAAGVVDGYSPGYVYDSSAQKDDSAPLYSWSAEKFVPLSWRKVDYIYREDGYLSQRKEVEGGWSVRQMPIKNRSTDPTEQWPVVDFVDAWIMANGVAVTGSTGVGFLPVLAPHVGDYWHGPVEVYGETGGILGRTKFPRLSTLTFQPAQIVTDYDVTDDGFITAETSRTSRWSLTSTEGNYLYLEEGVSSDPSPVWRETESESTRYFAIGESKHNRYTLHLDLLTGKISANGDSNLDGYLPTADQRTDIVPPESAFDDPEEYAHALAASRHENRPLKVEVCAPALEAVIIPWTLKGVVVEHAENEDDLTAVGIQMMKEMSSIDVQFPLPFNPLIRPAQRWILHLPILSIHYDLLIETVAHSQGERETWTQVTGRFDVI